MQVRHEVEVEGDSVVAVHHESEGDRWIFFSHGFVSDKEGSYEERCRRAVAEGWDAVRFDHRGCGESDLGFGEQNLSTRLEDIAGVVEQFDPDRCVLFGSSFGGKVALHAAVDDHPTEVEVSDRVEAVVARAPVTYVDVLEGLRGDGGAPEHGLADGFFDDLESYPFSAVEQEMDVPVAVFHGRDDGTVPVSCSFDAAEAVDVDVSLHAWEGEGHRFSRQAEGRMQRQMFRWLDPSDG